MTSIKLGMCNDFQDVSLLRRFGGGLGEEVWSRTDTESLGASGAEDEDSVPDQGGMVGVKKNNGWRTIRNIVRFTPFMNTFRKRLYPWVQVHYQLALIKIIVISIPLPRDFHPTQSNPHIFFGATSV